MPVIPLLPTDGPGLAAYKIDITGQYVELVDEQENLRLWRDYYDGKHRLLMSEWMRQFFEGMIDLSKDAWPVENYCAFVVDKIAERVNVVGIREAGGNEIKFRDIKDPEALTQQPLEASASWWDRNDLDRQEGVLTRNTLRDGEGYLVVDHFDGAPRMLVEQKWDGISGIRIRYEDEATKRNPLYAIKYWTWYDPAGKTPGGVEMATLYTKDAIYKYARPRGGDFSAFADQVVEGADPDGDWLPIYGPNDEDWPVSWVDPQTNEPLGLCVVPFTAPRGSVISHIIGLQNAANKGRLDLMAQADQQGFGLTVLQYPTQIGIPRKNQNATTPDDPTRPQQGRGIRPGGVLETTGSATRLPADPLEPMLAYLRDITIGIAAMSGIPLHHFFPMMTEVPSGTALVQMDATLAAQAKKCITWWEPSWRVVLTLAQRLARIWGGMAGEPSNLRAVYAPAEYEDETTKANRQLLDAQVAEKWTGIGIPLSIALKRLGWSDEEIKQVEDQKKKEQEEKMAALPPAMQQQAAAAEAGEVTPPNAMERAVARNDERMRAARGEQSDGGSAGPG